MRKTYNIALLVPSLNGGGAEKVIVNLANFFVGEGHNVWIVTSKKGCYFDLVHSKVSIFLLPYFSISLFGLKTPKLMTQVFWLSYFLNKYQPEILMSTLVSANMIAPYAKLLSWSKTKIVLRTANTFDRFKVNNLSFKEKLYVAGMKIAYKFADSLISNSEDTAKDVEKLLNIPSKRNEVIPNPVYFSECQKLSLETTGHPWVNSGDDYILAIGRLHPQKGFDVLLKAFKLLESKCSQIKLIVLGVGHEEGRLRDLAMKLKLSDKVDFPGFQDNPYPYLKKAKVFVLSSRWEGFGNVLVEALAMGTPIVSTDCPGGPRSILGNGQYGTLVEIENPEAMANAIQILLSGEMKYSEDSLIKRAKEFSIEEIGQKYFEYFLQTLQSEI